MKSLLASFTGALLSSAVFAADQPAAPYPEPPPIVYPPPAPAYYSWAGSYLGLNAGYGQGETVARVAVGPFSATSTEHLPGPLVGFQGGTNFQTGTFVFGLESDVQVTGQQQKYQVFGSSLTNSLPWFWTGRLRVGAALDRFLIYGTAGGGQGEYRTEIGSRTSSEIRPLWTVGAGVEAALIGGWTAKAEYLYLQSQIKEYNLGFGITGKDYATNNIVRFGVNYRLNFGPLSAGY
jgi:outer membrane immunogenic protein